MNAKTWLITFLTFTSICLSLVVALNIFIDPIWTFNHKNKFNTLQRNFDERLQKSVFMKYRTDIDTIDSLIMGSSRVTYYNQYDFKNMKAFNYAFSSGSPAEFEFFIDYAKNLKNGHFDNIIIGLDFVGVFVEPNSVKSNIKNDLRTILSIDDYSFFKRYLSFNTAIYSVRNIHSSIFNRAGHRSYDRSNVVSVDKVDMNKVQRITEHSSQGYYSEGSKRGEKKHYYESLLKLKDSNKETNFIVFTTPVASVFLEKIFSNENLRHDYFEWIKNTVSIFDEVYFFTYKNPFSENYSSLSKDGNHFYPEVGKMISEILTSDTEIEPYGLLINKQNLNDKLKYLKDNFNNKG